MIGPASGWRHLLDAFAVAGHRVRGAQRFVRARRARVSDLAGAIRADRGKSLRPHKIRGFCGEGVCLATYSGLLCRL